MAWKRLTRGDCPVCNGERKDCRQNTISNLVHCRSTEANPVDWNFLKLDTWGFGIWAYKPDTEAWNEQKREEWRREQEIRRKQEELQEQKRQQQSLSDVERDSQIRNILNQLTLSPRDRQRLKNRGFTEKQITSHQYRSVKKWQKLDWPVNPRLAGTSRNGQKLNNPSVGILCPVPNENGLYVGLRIYNPKSSENGLGKYTWLSSSKRGVTNKNQDGEHPIAIYYPDEYKCYDKIGLAEGLEFKAPIAANRLGYPVIGFSGCNFAMSPKTLQKALAKITQKLVNESTEYVVVADGQDKNPTHPTLVLLADAGCVLNQQVFRCYQNTVKLVESWSASIKIAWWGQVSKSTGDIDEINPEQIAQIVHLSPDDFNSLASRSQYFDQNRKSWRAFKQFTADKTIRQKYFKWNLPSSGTATFIKSSTGTGKTTQLLKWQDQLQDTGAIALGYRNTLLLQWCAKSGFYHLHEHDGLTMIGWNKSRIALCIDSLWRFQPSDFEGKVLIIDEVCSVILHLLFSPTIRNREKIANLFAEAIHRCDRLICLDGMMADWVIDYLMQFCRDKKLQRIKNTWNGNKPIVNFLMGTINVDRELKVNDRSPWLEELLERAPLPAIALDSQVMAESMDNLLTQRGYKVLRIDSKTVVEDHVKEFLRDCDAYLKKYQPDSVLFTPAAESGVDVSITNYFTHHFCFFFGVLGVDAILQMMARIRDIDCPKYFWCREWVSLPDTETIRTPIAQQVAKVIDQNLAQDMTLTMSGADQSEQIISAIRQALHQSHNAHWDTATKLTALSNYEKNNLRSCILEALDSHGYEVNLVEGLSNFNIKEQLLQATEEVKRQNCHDIFTAEDIPPSLLEKPLVMDASWPQRCKITKALTKKRLPGIEHTQCWSEEFLYQILYEERGFIEKQELFWLLHHPEAAKLIQQEKYHGLMRHFAQEEHLALWKIKHKFAVINALTELGILELLNNPDAVYTKDSIEILTIWKKGQVKKYRQILGRSPGKREYALRYVQRLLKMVGVSWSSQQAKDELGARTRFYQLDQSLLQAPERLIVLQCIERKYHKYLSGELTNLDWSVILEPLNQPQKELDKISPEAVAPQQVEVITHNPNYVYKSLGSCVTENNSEKSTLFEEKIKPLDSEKETQDLVDLLRATKSVEALWELLHLRQFTPAQLNQAGMMLAPDKQRQIAIWAKQIETGQVLDFNSVIQQINQQIKRIGRTIEYWKEYLLEKYNVASRLFLSDEQLIEFWNDLINFPAHPNLE